MPFATSHLSFQKCLQHAFCPNQRMSPLLFGWGLYRLCSRERHCNCQVISIAFLWPIHSCIYLPITLGSTKLCCLGFIATTVTLTAALVFINSEPDNRCFVTLPCLLSRMEAWSLVTQFSSLGSWSESRPWPKQLSLLILFDLPTIPSPTTAYPFRNVSICALLHPTLLDRVYPSG